MLAEIVGLIVADVNDYGGGAVGGGDDDHIKSDAIEKHVSQSVSQSISESVSE